MNWFITYVQHHWWIPVAVIALAFVLIGLREFRDMCDTFRNKHETDEAEEAEFEAEVYGGPLTVEHTCGQRVPANSASVAKNQHH